MRVETTVVVVMAQELALGHALADGDDRQPVSQVQEELLHLRLEVQAVPEHQVGLDDPRDVAAGLAIGVGINAGPHQGVDLGPIAGHLPGRVGDHRCGRHHTQRLGRRNPRRDREHAENNHRDQHQPHHGPPGTQI